MKQIISAKRVLLLVAIVFLAGCGSSSYFLLTSPLTVKQYHSKRLPVIGIEKIVIPEYLQSGKVATQLSPTQINYSNTDMWAEEMDASLTKQLISFVQKSFNHPNVYGYPWELSQNAGLRVKVTISRFIAYGDSVYLDANWEFYDMRQKKHSSRLFSVKVPSGQSVDSVVSSMNVAFEKLSEAIVKEINSKL